MRRDFRISFLIVKEFLGGLSDEEQRELESWKSSHRSLYERLQNPENAGAHASMIAEFPADKAWAVLDSRIRKNRRRRRLCIAASFVLPVLLVAGICLGVMSGRDASDPVMLQAVTLVGEEHELLLPDGTSVRLNSMSRLEYPETFGDDVRGVTLEGEAFFNVASSDVPFVVATPSMSVEVLGTAFDISAYEGEAARTVLVNGLVKVTSAGSAECILAPGQMASVSGDGCSISIEDVDTDFYTSWTRGKIYFRDERLEDIMETLSRWYVFDVRYGDSTVRDLRFGCYVGRFDDVDPFMDLLRKTGRIRVERKKDHYLLINNN